MLAMEVGRSIINNNMTKFLQIAKKWVPVLVVVAIIAFPLIASAQAQVVNRRTGGELTENQIVPLIEKIINFVLLAFTVVLGIFLNSIYGRLSHIAAYGLISLFIVLQLYTLPLVYKPHFDADRTVWATTQMTQEANAQPFAFVLFLSTLLSLLH